MSCTHVNVPAEDSPLFQKTRIPMTAGLEVLQLRFDRM